MQRIDVEVIFNRFSNMVVSMTANSIANDGERKPLVHSNEDVLVP